MKSESIVITEECGVVHSHKRICWSAIVAGAFVGIGLTFLLHLFNVTIGLSAFSVNESGAIAIAYGGVIGMFIGVVASMFLAGYTSGYLRRGISEFCTESMLGDPSLRSGRRVSSY